MAEIVAQLPNHDGQHHRHEVVEQRAHEVALEDKYNDDIHGGEVAVETLVSAQANLAHQELSYIGRGVEGQLAWLKAEVK